MLLKLIFTLCLLLIVQSVFKSGAEALLDKVKEAAQKGLESFQKVGQDLIDKGMTVYCEKSGDLTDMGAATMSKFLASACDAQCHKDHIYWKALENGPTLYKLICTLGKDKGVDWFGVLVGCFMKADTTCVNDWGEEIESLKETAEIIKCASGAK